MTEETEDVSYGTVLDTQELWHVGFREGEGATWKDVGTHRSSVADVLRTYDYWTENHPDVQLRFLKTTVRVEVADPEQMRKELEEETVKAVATELQSE